VVRVRRGARRTLASPARYVPRALVMRPAPTIVARSVARGAACAGARVVVRDAMLFALCRKGVIARDRDASLHSRIAREREEIVDAARELYLQRNSE
jgi:hypothetical protein